MTRKHKHESGVTTLDPEGRATAVDETDSRGWQERAARVVSGSPLRHRRRDLSDEKFLREYQNQLRKRARANEVALAGTILFLLDQSTYRQYIEKKLEVCGHTVISTQRLRECLRKVSEHQIDMMVVSLSGMNSFRLTCLLKEKSDLLYSMPFIICADSSTPEQVHAARQMNVQGFYCRPIQYDEFVQDVSGKVQNIRRKSVRSSHLLDENWDTVVIPGRGG